MKEPIKVPIAMAVVRLVQKHTADGDDPITAGRKALEEVLEQARIHGLREGPVHIKPSHEIDHPEFTGKPGARPKYPFWKMQPGEDYIVSGPHKMTVQAAAWSYGRNHNMKFTVTDNPDGDGLLVVRVE